jgi:hypothetical protein
MEKVFNSRNIDSALLQYVRKQFGKTAEMQRWYPYCSDSLMTHLGLDRHTYLAQRCLMQNEDYETFLCVWAFPDCPNHKCEVICYCMACEGSGAWGEYGPCDCIASNYFDRRDPNDDRFHYFKIPISNAWAHLDAREKIAVYELDPAFVFSLIPDAQNWYYPTKKELNDVEGVYDAKKSRAIKRQK